MDTSENSQGFWNLRLRFAHVLVFWSVMAGCLVSVFLLGLFAGRQQGVSSALKTQTDNSLRVPLETSAINAMDSRASLGPMVRETLRSDVPGGSASKTGLSSSAPSRVMDTSKSGAASQATGAEVSPISSGGVVEPGWYVQVVAANSRREAEDIVTKLGQNGIKAFIQVTSIQKLEYFRILSGPFRSRPDASRERGRILALEAVPSAPFVRRVN